LSKLALFFIVFFPIVSFANNNESGVEQMVDYANELRLSQHPTWLKLMHYEPSFGDSRNFASAIHDSEFFIAKDGAFNPRAELVATIKAFQQPLVDGFVDNHAQCKFPARLLWLQRSVGEFAATIKMIHCPKYDEWTLSNSIKSISVVYASGFLGNPASYYGHILLKLNSNRSAGAVRLFDPSVNYGAIIPPDEDPVTYILKGIFGGYDGGFSQTDYYFHNRNYGELELRDIWEYEINLEQKEVDLIVAHAWEVLGKRYTYYFFRKNCAYRLAELIDLTEGVSILPTNKFFTLPRTLLQNLHSSQIRNKPLLRSVDFRPSRQSKFYKKFNSLVSSERTEVRNSIEARKTADGEMQGALTIESKVKVIDTILDYYQFAKSAEIMSKNDADKSHRRALVKRFQLPPSSSGSNNELSLAPPHAGRKPSYLQVGVTYSESFGNGYSILIRPAYYDVLDAAPGQVQDSALTMGEIELFTQSDGVYIKHFDLLKIESINTANTNLPGDKGRAWKVKLGIQQQNLSCLDCLTTRLEGDYGYALNLNPRVLVSAYVGGGVQGNRKGSGKTFIRGSVFSHIKFTDKLNMRLGVELPKKIDGSVGHKNRYILEARQRLGVNTDIRFRYEKNKLRQYAVNLGYYF
tara:strand:+ start:9810 stop:11711 length:1902 start_codon:yes stop_codon:yes gene_type:complete